MADTGSRTHDDTLHVRRAVDVRVPQHRPHQKVSHTGHRLIYFTAGRSTVQFGCDIEVVAGCFLVIPAGVPHRALSGENIDFWALGFCPTCMQLPDEHPLMRAFQQVRRGFAPLVHSRPERAPWVTQLFGELEAECTHSTPESARVQGALLTLLLAEVHRAMPPTGQVGTEPTLVNRALDYVQRHALAGISLRDVAKGVHASPAHLTTVVKAATGFTVGQWITSTRVSAASGWLLHSDASLDEITSHVGWKDTTHFIRQFRKRYGQTPAAWRRGMRAGKEP